MNNSDVYKKARDMSGLGARAITAKQFQEDQGLEVSIEPDGSLSGTEVPRAARTERNESAIAILVTEMYDIEKKAKNEEYTDTEAQEAWDRLVVIEENLTALAEIFNHQHGGDA